VIRVTVSYVDGQGYSESLVSSQTAVIASVNDAPTGAPVVTGTTTEDQTLTADTSTIADADGLGAFAYQWQRSTDGGTSWVDVGSDASTYLLDDADVGAVMRVAVSYTDGQGHAETLTSAATAAVAGLPPLLTDLGTMLEDGVLAIRSQDLLASMPDAQAGAWAVTALSVAEGDGTVARVGSGDWVFTPGRDWYGSVRFEVQVTNGAETRAGSATLVVEPVNDAPHVLMQASVQAVADTAYGLGTIVVTDVEGGLMRTSLSVRTGTLTLDLSGGATIVSGHNASGLVELQGSAEQITAALGGLIYRPAAGQLGSDVLTLVASDEEGGTVTLTLSIDVSTSPADGPTLVPPAAPDLLAPPETRLPAAVAPQALEAPPSRADGAAVADGTPDAAAAVGFAPRSEGLVNAGEQAADEADRRRPGAAPGGSATPESQDAVVVVDEPLLDFLAWDPSLDGADATSFAQRALNGRGVEVDNERMAGSGASEQEADVGLTDVDLVDVAAVSFSAGFVWWLTRSGGMLTMMLMGIPTWRHVDLLPVLARADDDADEPVGLAASADGSDTVFQQSAYDVRLDEMFDAQPELEETKR
jgi:hypothetical protein